MGKVDFQLGKRRSKFGAVKTVVDGISFDSALESRRYSFLKFREKAGEITHLEIQSRYAITINSVHIGDYLADFRYFTVGTPKRPAELVVEDCKGHLTDLYRWKKKCVEACYPGVVIREIKADDFKSGFKSRNKRPNIAKWRPPEYDKVYLKLRLILGAKRAKEECLKLIEIDRKKAV